MNRLSIVGALLLTACAGGQTGEITGLTACNERVGVVAVDEASMAGRSAEEQLAALTTSAETELVWEDGASSALAISFALTGEPATLWGGVECARPWLEAPVTITLRTADLTLDETIDGTVLLSDTELAAVQARASMRELDGTLAGHPTDTFRVDLLSERGAVGGELWLRPADEDADDRLLASF